LFLDSVNGGAHVNWRASWALEKKKSDWFDGMGCGAFELLWVVGAGEQHMSMAKFPFLDERMSWVTVLFWVVDVIHE
jgi:hypothetical protein